MPSRRWVFEQLTRLRQPIYLRRFDVVDNEGLIGSALPLAHRLYLRRPPAKRPQFGKAQREAAAKRDADRSG